MNETNSDMARVAEMANSLKNLKTIQSSDISKEISELKVFTTNTLDSLANNIVAKISMLEQIDKAISFQQENLERVHKINIATTTLESLLLAQEAQKKLFDEEMAAIKQTWMREQEAYKYQLTKDQRKDADDFDVFRKKRMAAFEEERNERLQEITEREAEFSFQIKLMQKDNENAAKLAEQTISSLQKRNAELEKQVSDLRNQENMATQRVQAIAEKAIENASKQQTVFMPNQNDSNYTEMKRK